MGAIPAKWSVHYAAKIQSIPEHLTHDAVFDNKYIKLFDARPNDIRTSGFRIKEFLIAFNIDIFYHLGISDH